MASLDSVLTKQALSKGVIRQVTADKAIGMRMRHIGTGAVTSVTVDQSTDVEFVTVDDGTDTYLFSTYTTMAKLIAKINADGRFEVFIVDALLSENPDDFFVNGAISAGTDENGVVCYDFLVDESASETMSCCLTPGGPNFDKRSGHRVHLQEIYYNVDHTAASDALTVWKRSKDGTETELFHMLSVDVTDTTETFASGEGYITGGTDDELIVQVDGTVTAAGGNFIRVAGKSE